ncbi:hypothetical protein JOD51_000042 [Curtobacterium herbarum]|nr:hypothetical protein [Curtobacterium herbarum]
MRSAADHRPGAAVLRLEDPAGPGEDAAHRVVVVACLRLDARDRRERIEDVGGEGADELGADPTTAGCLRQPDVDHRDVLVEVVEHDQPLRCPVDLHAEHSVVRAGESAVRDALLDRCASRGRGDVEGETVRRQEADQLVTVGRVRDVQGAEDHLHGSTVPIEDIPALDPPRLLRQGRT